MARIRPLKIITLFLSIASIQAAAREYRVGSQMGFGGTGLTKLVSVKGTTRSVSRSEGPGTLGFFIETFYNDKIGVGIDHTRGFRLGPFSSGLNFTGIYLRYYFFGPAPQAINSEGSESTIQYKRYAMFLGWSGGVGQGHVSRNADQVPNISATGVYMGFRAGADYPMGDRWGIRPELMYHTTFMASEVNAPTLTEFSLHCAFYWSL